ncbi:hypothetical protein HQ325_08775 [Rhodococcus sp. BP-349]|uniref:hypothetical protein n=1 Tax=unclassified Rhodococcus (in: high G+C Gram-positive bacteria) TaxID=192944 RepID=UPI001C9B423F|nr:MULTISPECIES: hypothetical protein [unclassified Rhodococcus (in: high G+C Gram-positive bacteria)]MBY6538762.1 hypothetical protein [Rhodococcus sp. BP-363]MBY6543099.1 hypothetical protein [Rhodococcus sp. BP-369]MBY6562329.1 hypothetical protein [Rhodococcus sp. BP-370]MBY6576621.1 hypothetical protein [Rhodococcus sp. BP-364]MBY6585922.1 hypothetical protein [Rhodococcus sp. BP-358]
MTAPTQQFTPTRRDAELAGRALMYAVSELSLIRVTGQGGAAYAQLQVCPSGARYRSVVDGLSPRAARELTNGYHANFHHPVLYAAALRLGAERLAELVPMSRSLRAVLVAAPAVAATADITENVVNLYLHRDTRRITDATATVSSALSIVKWGGTLGPLAYMTAGFFPIWGRAVRDRLARGR